MIVGMMILPLPHWLLDSAFVREYSPCALDPPCYDVYLQAAGVQLVSISAADGYSLPAGALNISATRLILLHADAGQVISAFGQVVVGGNYVVGIVVFIILVIIQFVVITNGAGRVAEVAARFTLDAMPGKQMAIDADLNAGIIDEREAQRRRKEVAQEADFYGAMDGATKFVRGDAIAAIIMIIVNILGGFAVGIAQRGMDIVQALQTYTLLTVGEGLVTQIPALLISTATGLMVTKNGSEKNLGWELMTQVLAKPKAIGITAAVFGILLIVPGMPKVLLLLACSIAAGMSYVLANTEKQAAVKEKAKVQQQEKAAPKAPQSMTDLIGVDPLSLEIGYGLDYRRRS